MDLDLEPVRASGRAKQPLTAEIIREITPADLALLATEQGIKPPLIKALRDSHHAIARCVAEGKPNTETMLITGYSASRISILKADPAFQELVEFYRNSVEEARDEAFTDGLAKASAIRNDLMETYHDRLLDTPEAFDIEALESGIKTFADRSGLGPQSKSTNVNVNVDLAARVSAGRQRVARLVQLAPPGSPAEPLPAPIESGAEDRTPSPPTLDLEISNGR